MNKFLKLMIAVVTIFSIGGILIAFFSKEHPTDARIFCAVFGALILCFIYVPTFRNVCLAVSFLTLSISGVGLMFKNGSFIWTGAAIEFGFICAFFHFIHKVFGNIHWNKANRIGMSEVDYMTGLEFEQYTADLLSRLGFYGVNVTKASGDQGIDIIAHMGGLSYAIQCKHYSGSLGNSAVQEAYAGKAYYGCDHAVVITNSHFTSGAKDLACSTGVLLWDRSTLQKMIYKASRSRWFKRTENAPVHYDDNNIPQVADDPKRKMPPSETFLPQSKIPSVPVSTASPQRNRIDPSFIAEAQWYAARGGADLNEDEQKPFRPYHDWGSTLF